jgi:lipopolysaccharide exporter
MYIPSLKIIINKFILPTQSGDRLSKRFIKGGFWIFILRGCYQLFTITRLIILARILAPNDFGLMAIGLLSIKTLEAFSQIGFHQALIQNQKEIKNYLDTAWSVSILRGIILCTVLYLSAAHIGSFLNAPESRLIIQVMGFSILLYAFTNVGIIYFQKEMEFYKQFLYEFSGTAVDFLVAVVAALLFKSVWALVLGYMTGNVIKCIASYILHPYRPVFKIELGQIKELFHYGRWIFGSVILIYIGGYCADIGVSRFLGATALGFYRMAYQISNAPATELSYVIGRVAFPTYAKLQGDEYKLQRAYFRVLGLTSVITIPVSVMIMCLAPDFTKIFLGEKWLPIVPLLQLLAVASLIKSIISTGTSLFTGSGHPQFEFYTQLTRGIVILSAIYPLTVYFMLPGAATAVILSIIFMFIIWYLLSKKVSEASWCKYANTFWPPLVASGVMAASIYLLKFYLNPIQSSWLSSILIFSGISILGILIYSFIMYLIHIYLHGIFIVDEAIYIYKSIVRKNKSEV